MKRTTAKETASVSTPRTRAALIKSIEPLGYEPGALATIFARTGIDIRCWGGRNGKHGPCAPLDAPRGKMVIGGYGHPGHEGEPAYGAVCPRHAAPEGDGP